MDNSDTLKVLIVSSEVSPYSKSGGLGEVMGSLPKELRKLGVDARIVFPKYKSVEHGYKNDMTYIDSFVVSLGWRKQSASIYRLNADVPVYTIENDYYFGRDGFYGYGDDYERFAFFSKAAVEFLGHINFRPDVIHLNDWQTGPACVYLKDVYGKFLFFQGIKSLFTIHNLQYQGVFGREILSAVDLSDYYFTSDKMEFYGMVNYMKSGLVYADAISTVSPTYANEIKTPMFGYSLDGVIRSREKSLYGIINGIDTDIYNPETDPRLFVNYDASTLELKRENKHRLQEELGLKKSDAPMIGIVSRLADQKGLDLVALCMDELMSKDIQLVILGTGEGRYENLFRSYAWRFKEKMSANICFNESLASKIYAGSDMFLMPSLFEPCGLGQLFAMRYFSAPIVRKTGGLADTVTHYNESTHTGNGFVFEDYVASGMMWAINEALRVYGHKDEWARLIKNANASDFSWRQSAAQYIELYKRI